MRGGTTETTGLQPMAASAASVVLALLVIACGTPSSAPAYAGQSWPTEEDIAIERAKRHPVAQPRPRPALPEQTPPAASAEASVAAQPAGATQPSAAPRSTAEPAPLQAPPDDPAEVVPAPPTSRHVWAPGYWYWSDRGYLWISGTWLPPRVGFVFIAPSWHHSSDVGWRFRAGGWARAGMAVVVHPIHRRHPLPPPVWRPPVRHRSAPPAPARERRTVHVSPADKRRDVR